MDQHTAFSLGLLILRLGVSGLYLFAAWQNTKFLESYTLAETQVLLRRTPWETNPKVVRVAAIGGLLVMYAGGLMVGLGALGRIGGLLLAGFTFLGFLIHRVRWIEAREFAQANEGEIAAMGWSSYGGHFSSALKNLTLICVSLSITLMGTGSYSLLRFWD